MTQSRNDFLSQVESLIDYLECENKSQIFLREGVKKYSGDSDFEIDFRSISVEFVEKNFSIKSKIFLYKNIIVSLYGFLERYVEDVIFEYLQIISGYCHGYESLPLAIRKNHLNLSIEKITKLKSQKGIEESIRVAKINSTIKSMGSMFGGQDDFILNFDAYLEHTSNFRYESINKIFSQVGIDNISRLCVKNANFMESLCEKYNLDDDVNHQVALSLLIAELDDLAQRRNEVAHGVIVDSIESLEISRSRIRFIESYVCAMDEILSTSLDEFRAASARRIELGKPDKVFQNINVIGFNKIEIDTGSEINLSVGDELLAINEKSDRKVLTGQVISLELASEKKERIKIPCDSPATIQVDFNLSEHFIKRSIYLLLKN